jgi:carboxypeptidase family protein
MRMRAGTLVIALVLLVSFGTSVHGQGSTASMAGVVRDEQGLVVPGAALTMSGIENTFARTVTTDSNGAFEFAGLLSGDYKLAIELSGFARKEMTVSIAVNQRVRLDAVLQAGGVAQQVEVTTTVPLLHVVCRRTRSASSKSRPAPTLPNWAAPAPGKSTSSPNRGRSSTGVRYTNTLRNSKFDSPEFTNPHELPPFSQNQFGGTFGGLGSHGFFFFGGYEGLRTTQHMSNIMFVPDMAVRTGDFSAYAPVYDPQTTRANPADFR